MTSRAWHTLFLASLFDDIDVDVGHLKRRVAIEKVRDEGEIEVVRSFGHLSRREKHSTLDLVSFLQHQLGSLQQIRLLQ